MTATCQICGAFIQADHAALLLNPGTDPAAAAAVAEISRFDLLAGRMSVHMSEAHQKQAHEMAAVMHLAGKVYAMTWAESKPEEPNYSALREAWRTGILQMIKTTGGSGQAVTPAPAPFSDSDTGEGSNEKKSVRKDSN